MRRSLTLAVCLALLPASRSAGIRLLDTYSSSTPTLVTDVQDGSNLYLASPDKAVKLSKITLTTNGQSITLDKLLGSFDDNGYNKGWPVNKDLTIANTNDGATTGSLMGYFFISTPDMAKDPNFLVYAVADQKFTVDRSANTETTLVLLNLRKEKVATDPMYKTFYNTRVENFSQPKATQLYMYHDTPTDGYTDPTYKETVQRMIFMNPVSLFPTGNPDADIHFFDNIEPVQFSQMAWFIRALGGGIKFDVSQKYVDQSTYTTTKESTTGYTMNQLYTYNTTVNFKNNPNPQGIVGLLVSTHLFDDVKVEVCNELECAGDNLVKQVGADSSQYNMNVTTMYVEPSTDTAGSYYIQYFRIEGNPYPPTTAGPSTSPTIPTGSSPTTQKSPESTTKSAATSLTILSLISSLIYSLRRV